MWNRLFSWRLPKEEEPPTVRVEYVDITEQEIIKLTEKLRNEAKLKKEKKRSEVETVFMDTTKNDIEIEKRKLREFASKKKEERSREIEVENRDITDDVIEEVLQEERNISEMENQADRHRREQIELDLQRVVPKCEKLQNYRFGEYNGVSSYKGLDISDMQRKGAIKIGIFGPFGSGKSSFVYTCERTIQGRNRGTAVVKDDGKEGTVRLMDYLNGRWHFKLVDTRGFWTYGSGELAALSNILFGNISMGQQVKFDGSYNVVGIGDEGDVRDWIHGVIFVISATDIRLTDGDLHDYLNPMRSYMRPKGIGIITVVTHIDNVDESEVEKIKDMASAATGSSPHQTFCITNYTGDLHAQGRRPQTELDTCDILTAALIMAERYIRISKRQLEKRRGLNTKKKEKDGKQTEVFF